MRVVGNRVASGGLCAPVPGIVAPFKIQQKVLVPLPSFAGGKRRSMASTQFASAFEEPQPYPYADAEWEHGLLCGNEGCDHLFVDGDTIHFGLLEEGVYLAVCGDCFETLWAKVEEPEAEEEEEDEEEEIAQVASAVPVLTAADIAGAVAHALAQQAPPQPTFSAEHQLLVAALEAIRDKPVAPVHFHYEPPDVHVDVQPAHLTVDVAAAEAPHIDVHVPEQRQVVVPAPIVEVNVEQPKPLIAVPIRDPETGQIIRVEHRSEVDG